ncbi:MAG: hypothetical protein JW795_09065 [Chitinivibrionales bacterium]|nr:hypothetical protein [Chitinivibrionales bacterium]
MNHTPWNQYATTCGLYSIFMQSSKQRRNLSKPDCDNASIILTEIPFSQVEGRAHPHTYA